MPLFFVCEAHKLCNVLFEDDEAVVKFSELMNSSSTVFNNLDDDDDDGDDDDGDERIGIAESNCLNLDNRALRERAALLHLSNRQPFVVGILSFF